MGESQSTGDVITIERPDTSSLVAEMAPLVAQARAFEVTNVESDRVAQERGRQLRIAERRGEEHFAKAKKAASDAHKSIVAAIADMVAPWVEARQTYFRKSEEYQTEQRRLAEQERLRLQDKARQEEEERKLAAAQEAQDSGHPEEAEAILNEDLAVPAVTVAPAVAQVKGVSQRTLWSAEVFDFMALVRYVAAHPEWENLLEPNAPNLNRLAVAQHETLKIPGVRAISTVSRSTRQ